MMSEIEELERHGLRRRNERIMWARLKAGISQEKMAEIRGVTVRTVQRWESREFWSDKLLSKHKEAVLKDISKIVDRSYIWIRYNFGDKESDYKHGKERQFINQELDKLSIEKHQAVADFIEAMMQ